MPITLNGTTGISTPNLDSAGTVTTTNLVNGSPLAFRNKIINGSFQIAQRNTVSTVTPSAGVTTYPSLDRWFIAQTGATASLFLGQTTPQTTGVFKAGYFGRTSGQTNVPNYIFMGQQIESFNVYDLRGKTATVSFNAFRGTNAPTNLIVVARFGTSADESSSNGLGGSWTGYSSATASALSIGTTVASYTYNFSIPSNASEMMVLFYYAPTGTAGANEWFALENLQLEAGSVATPFEVRPIGNELALCQRYYQKSFLTTQTPQNATGGVAIGGAAAVLLNTNQTTKRAPVYFPVLMRSSPLVVLYQTNGNGTAGQFGNAVNAADSTSYPATTVAATEKALSVQTTYTGTLAVDFAIHWTADAEL